MFYVTKVSLEASRQCWTPWKGVTGGRASMWVLGTEPKSSAGAASHYPSPQEFFTEHSAAWTDALCRPSTSSELPGQAASSCWASMWHALCPRGEQVRETKIKGTVIRTGSESLLGDQHQQFSSSKCLDLVPVISQVWSLGWVSERGQRTDLSLRLM